jgi:hypothetical protein
MAFVNIKEPVAGNIQTYNVNGTDINIDIPEYLTDMLGNINTIGSQTITSYSGTYTPAAATAATAIILNTATVYLEPVTLSSVLVQQTLTTPVNGGIIHVTANAQMTPSVTQAGVFPALGLSVEWFNKKAGTSGAWQYIHTYSNFLQFYSNVGSAVAALLPISFYTMIPDTLPLSQYRITLLSGVFATGSVALPHTGRWTLDANLNSFQFHTWVGG